jgi:hypothetical protein
MPKYLVSWTEEDWYNVVIEAETHTDAIDKFYNMDYNSDNVVRIGSELQDSVNVEEV